jgi:uncharacterized protein (DUF952 family)
MPSIFHIARSPDWQRAQAAGDYRPPSLDTEGFIHLSTAAQVAPVANARFRGTPGLVLVRVAPDRLHAPLKYEVPDDSPERFPHLYGPLNLDAVEDVTPFLEGPDGFAPPIF